MATTERSPRQIRLLTTLLLFGTFLLGAVAGAGLSQWGRGPRHHPHLAPFLPGPPGALKLTPEQEGKAREITEKYRPRLQAIVRESLPKVQATNEQMEDELRILLTQEQRKILDEMKARRPPMAPVGPMPPGGHGPGFGPLPGPPPLGLPGMMPPPAGEPPAPPSEP